MKKIAVINDISGFGKCSLTAALPIISACGIQACPLPTGIFSNQTGYPTFESVDMTPYLDSFIAEWEKLAPRFDAILTGFIPNSAQGEILLRFVERFKTQSTLLAVDPIMGDDGAVYPCYDDKSVAAVKRLAAKADLLLPNVTELSLLCGNGAREDYTVDEIEAMCRTFGKTQLAVTGIAPDASTVANAVYDGKRFTLLTSERRGGHFSGTGDIFSACVVSAVVNGSSLTDAVKKAVRFIERAIDATPCAADEYYRADGIDFEPFLKEL